MFCVSSSCVVFCCRGSNVYIIWMFLVSYVVVASLWGRHYHDRHDVEHLICETLNCKLGVWCPPLSPDFNLKQILMLTVGRILQMNYYKSNRCLHLVSPLISETRSGRTLRVIIIILSEYRYPLLIDDFVMRKHILQEIRITRSILSIKTEAITCLGRHDVILN
jgi:hypothetical protein